MKKIVALFLVLVMLFSLVGCNLQIGSPDEEDAETEDREDDKDEEEDEDKDTDEESAKDNDLISTRTPTYTKKPSRFDKDPAIVTTKTSKQNENRDEIATTKKTTTTTTKKSTTTTKKSTSTTKKSTTTTKKSTTTTKKPTVTTKKPTTTTKKTTTTTKATVPTAPAKKTVSVPKLSQSSTDITAATIKTYTGNITYEDQVDTYSFTAPRDGYYTFKLSEVKSGTNFYVHIKDYLDDTKKSSALSNDEHISVYLENGQTYTVEIEGYYDSTRGSYQLEIGNQTPTTDISSYTEINDSIVFYEQNNYYTFTPTIDGWYTFKLSEVRSGKTFYLYVKDHLDSTVKFGALSNNEYVSVKLEKGETYTIQIKGYYDSTVGTYCLNIGKQKSTVSVSHNYIVKDEIEFYEQVLYYSFNVTKSANHTITITGSTADLYVYVKNYLDETVEGSALSNGESITVKDLKAGETYSIVVYTYYDTKTTPFTMTIDA